ncbi:MAG TPA: Maf family protein [Marinobacterium sp.]|nr:Maf family protein [Marinobacterium sp.]
MTRLVLASASARRRELLQQIGVSARVLPADIDESVHNGESASAYVSRLAIEKAEAVRHQLENDEVSLGSDTSVVVGGKILGKPDSLTEARVMLHLLSASRHQVMTAVALAGAGSTRHRLVVTDVWFRPITDAQIDAYWASGEPQDKAGAYGIQGLGAVFVDRIEGSYSAVVGLPLAETAELLEEAGVPVWQLSVKN